MCTQVETWCEKCNRTFTSTGAIPPQYTHEHYPSTLPINNDSRPLQALPLKPVGGTTCHSLGLMHTIGAAKLAQINEYIAKDGCVPSMHEVVHQEPIVMLKSICVHLYLKDVDVKINLIFEWCGSTMKSFKITIGEALYAHDIL